MKRRSLSWMALVGVGLAGVVAVSAATALAARSAASPFELTLEYQHMSWEVPIAPLTGTFTARAPFCGSGTFVELQRAGAADAKYRLTCDDGSGSLVVSASVGLFDFVAGHLPVVEGSWRILEGAGSYAGLRGTGSQRTELSEGPFDPECVDAWGADAEWVCPWLVTRRSTLEGVAAEDAIAPTIGFSDVQVTKLPRPAGAYSVEAAIALRDDVEGSPVFYKLRVTPTTSARELASNVGTTRKETVAMTMRLRYDKPPKRAVLLRLSVADEVGNESSATQVLKLPR